MTLSHMNELLLYVRDDIRRAIAMNGLILKYNEDDILVLWDGDQEYNFHEVVMGDNDE